MITGYDVLNVWPGDAKGWTPPSPHRNLLNSVVNCTTAVFLKILREGEEIDVFEMIMQS